MFKIRNKKVYSKMMRPRKTQPIVVEKVENKPSVIETVKKVSEIEATIKAEIVAPVIVGPTTINVEKIDESKEKIEVEANVIEDEVIESVEVNESIEKDVDLVEETNEGNEPQKSKKSRKKKTQKTEE